MRINQNISAMNTHSRLTQANNAKSNNLARLSSGLRINKAGDDAAGLSISEKMRGQVRGLNQAIRNAQDGISYIQTAEGALNEVSAMLIRMKELAVQAGNDTYGEKDIENLELEMTQLGTEISKIVENTEFNGINVFDKAIKIQINDKTDGTMDVGLKFEDPNMGSTSTIATIETAIDGVNTARATFGSQQNRLEHTINNLTTTTENLAAAESRIRDVDMAHEMMEFTKNNILSQAATSMLAQANQTPQQVLQLLQ
jgi:flagellin